MKRGGFTLIELLIVIAVIGVLSGLVVSAINSGGFRSKARDSERTSDLKLIQTALELYYAEFRSYPVSGSGGTWENLNSAGSKLVSALEGGGHINNVPVDPIQNSNNPGPCQTVSGYRYNYKTDGNGDTYVLTSIMETATSNDGFACDQLNNWATLGSCVIYATGDVCYGVENP
jgi:prepilin-type N-terminal cleavage/methylation domain-containing protein